MDENPCELRRRKVQVPRPTFKKSEGFEPKISKLAILTQLEAGSCAKLVFFRFVAVKPLVRLLAVSFHCPFALRLLSTPVCLRLAVARLLGDNSILLFEIFLFFFFFFFALTVLSSIRLIVHGVQYSPVRFLLFRNSHLNMADYGFSLRPYLRSQ